MPYVESTSPQNPDDLVLRVPTATAEDVAALAARVRSAQRKWAARPVLERSAVMVAAAGALDAAAEELTALAVREVGKPLAEARAEMQRGIAIVRYYAQQMLDPAGEILPPSLPQGGLLYTVRRPRGVVGLITPWNFPVAIPLWKLAPAIAFGNGVLLKPAPEATACGLRLAEVLATVLPDDLLSVVVGDADTGAAVVANTDAVSFTGSIDVGRVVSGAAVARGIPVQAELGGQNAALVLPDADVEQAAASIAGAAMAFAGQKCTATKRVITVGPANAVRDALVAAVERLGYGDPADPHTLVGPVIDERARSAVLAAADSARAAGGVVLTGAQADADRPGWFVRPTVVDGVDTTHELACDEVFGPICAVFTTESVNEAVALANSVRHGLVSAVYTRDLDLALSVVDRLDTGLVRVNAPTSGVDFYAPFGGEKASSYGPREQGLAAREFYTSLRTVTVAPQGAPSGHVPMRGPSDHAGDRPDPAPEE